MNNTNIEETITKENTEEKKHSHHKHSGHHHHHHRHHSHTSQEVYDNQYGYQFYKFEEDPNEEQKNNNVFYKDMTKYKIQVALKRGVFCAILLAIVAGVTSSIFVGGSGGPISIFGGNTARTEEINELKIKIIQYEDKIEELENELAELRRNNAEQVFED